MINREIIYERNLTGSYMKIPVCLEPNYDEKIMLKKKIPGLLPVERCFEDGVGRYWYNISGKQSLDTFCKIKDVGIDFVEKMIYSICSEIEILDWNLLDQNCLLLDPELIFVTNVNHEIIFTVYPGNRESVSKGFQQLMEYLLKKIDHNDMAAVHSAYNIYEKTLDEDYSIMDIRDELTAQKQKELQERMPEKEIFSNYSAANYGTLDHSADSGAGNQRRKTPWLGSVGRKATGKEASGKAASGRESAWGRTTGKEITRKEITRKEMARREAIQRETTRREAIQRETTQRETTRREPAGREMIEKKARWKESDKETQDQGLNQIMGQIISRLQQWKAQIYQFLGQNQGERAHHELRNKDSVKSVDAPQIVYPDDVLEEVKEEIHPTICLASFSNKPRGMLLYEGTEDLLDIKLQEGINTIGKGVGVYIKIERETISHHHARIDFRNGEFYLEDLNSTNGTYVNEELLPYKETRVLRANDKIRFADVTYRFV